MKDARRLLMGKRISFHDRWNGSYDWFTIGHVENADTSVRVFAEKGKGWGIFISKSQIRDLVSNGKIEEHGEIEYCSFTRTWTLK